jgi:hypothetical protein
MGRGNIVGSKKTYHLGEYRLRLAVFLTILVYLFGLVGNFQTVSASTFTNRSVQISTARPSIIANHTFRFTYPSTAVVGSIVLEYCDNSPVLFYTCNVPPGLDVTAATLSSQSGNIGFSIDGADTTANQLVITRAPGAGLAVPSSYSFDNITNPGTPSHSEFVRIRTYASVNGTGSPIDNGSVAFAVLTPFNVGAYVPPFLTFCVAITVGPNCSSTTGDSLDLGILEPTHASPGTSQFATATNDPAGYVVFVLGTTMTSGNNVIPAAASPTLSLPGVSRFGMNLRANASPAVGSDPFGAGTGTPTANYSFSNFFTFGSGDAVATSPLTTDFNTMTVSYLVNVSNAQPPGIYATTLTYVATVQF